MDTEYQCATKKTKKKKNVSNYIQNEAAPKERNTINQGFSSLTWCAAHFRENKKVTQ